MENLYSSKSHGFSNASVVANAEFSEESVLSLVAVLGSSISLVGLVFAFITYSLFSDWRNLSGTALMNLLASLFMTQLLYVVGVGGVQDRELCVGLVFGLQYIRLTVHCWLLIMIHNTYRAFTDNMSLLPPIDPKIKATFWKCSLLGWCSPGLMLGLAVALQSADTNRFSDVSKLEISNCWFLTGHALIFAFVIPIIAVFILTIVYLTKTFIAIKQTVGVQVSKKVRDKMHKKRTLQLSLFIKMTTIVSAVSLSLILYQTTPLRVFWVVFNVLQGIQGIFIALCVTCNCQVLKIYTRSLRRSKYGDYGGINADMSVSTSLQMLNLDPAPDVV